MTSQFFSSCSKIRIFGFCLMLVACDQTSGCSEQGEYTFPEKDKIQSAIQVRLTEPGLAFLGDQLTPLIQDALPEELSSCLPGESGTSGFVEWRYCNEELCDNGETGCNVSIDVGGVSISAVEPSSVRLTVSLDQISLRFDVGADPFADCNINIEGPEFPVFIDLLLSTPMPRRNLTFQIQEADYELSDLIISLEANDGFLSPVCEILDGAFNLPFLRELVLDSLEVAIDGPLLFTIQAFINSFICLPCETDEDPVCTGQGGTCFAGSCFLEDLTCVPRPLGVQGEFDIGSLLSDFAPNLKAQLAYFLNPGSYAEIEEEGLSLGVITGLTTDLNRCVPAAEPPPVDEPPRAEVLRTNLTPEGIEYDIGLGISQTLIDRALWSAHQSGATCLSVIDLPQLNSATLGILLPRLGELTRGPAPIALTLSPQLPPSAIIGENRLGPPNADGERALEDPLITLDWPDLWIDFHTFIEDRWTRLFSLKVHVILPLGITFDPSGGIVPLLGDLNAALTDVEAINDELLLDDPERITMLLPALTGPLIGVALSSLTDPIALPDLLGFTLAPNDQSLRGVTEDDEDFIAVFADLMALPMEAGMEMEAGQEMQMEMQKSDEEPMDRETARSSSSHPRGEDAIDQAIDTFIEPLAIHRPAVERFLSPQGQTEPPWVLLQLGTTPLNASPRKNATRSISSPQFEYSWRVDQGAWHLFTTAERLKVRDPILMIPGEHWIEVRARRIGAHLTLDPTPARLRVVIDRRAPQIKFTSSNQRPLIHVDVSDLVSPPDLLTVSYRWSEGPWVEVALDDRGHVELDTEARAGQVIEVRAVDEVGEVSQERALIGAKTHALIGRGDPAEVGSASAGCDCATMSADSNIRERWSMLLILCLFMLLKPRTRRLHASDAPTRSSRHPLSRWIGGLSIWFTLCAFSLSIMSLSCDDEAPAKREGDVFPDGCIQEECGANQSCVEGNCRTLKCDDDPSLCDDLECGEALAQCNEMDICECGDTPLCPEGCGEDEYCCFAENECQRPPSPCRNQMESCAPGYELFPIESGQVDPDLCERVDEVCECQESSPLDPGYIGRYSDLTAFDGQAWVSGYADTYGDLVVGHGLPDQPLNWSWVDGVPLEDEVVASPSGPRGGIDALGEDVGAYTSIAVGAGGIVHVAYFDLDQTRLKYAIGQPDEDAGIRWRSYALDEMAGWWPDLALDARGRPTIIYRALGETREEMDEDGVLHSFQMSEVRWISAEMAVPTAQTAWRAPATLHSVEYDTELMSSSYPEGTGLFNTQALSNTGEIALAWYDRSGGNLWLSRAEIGDGPLPEVIPEVLAGWAHETRRGDMGANVSVSFDREGALHLCYQDGVTDSVRYMSPDLDRDELIDDGVRFGTDGREVALHVVGEDCSVHFDEMSRPLVLYQDATGHQLVLSRRDATGSWLRVTLRGPNQGDAPTAAGFYANAVSYGQEVWVSHYVYDHQVDPAQQYLELFSTQTP